MAFLAVRDLTNSVVARECTHAEGEHGDEKQRRGRACRSEGLGTAQEAVTQPCTMAWPTTDQTGLSFLGQVDRMY